MKTDFYNSSLIKKNSRRGYYKEKLDFIVKILKDGAGKKQDILDIGCNDGELMEVYSKYGSVLGVDLNLEGIKECKNKGLNCISCDFFNLPNSYFGKFDVIVAGDIIEHIFETDLFLQKIYSFLTSDGKLLLTTPNLASFGRRIMLFCGVNPYIEFSTKLPSADFNVGHIRYFTFKNLKDLLYSAGFKNIKIQGDRINLSGRIFIPNKIARSFPGLSRNLMALAQK